MSADAVVWKGSPMDEYLRSAGFCVDTADPPSPILPKTPAPKTTLDVVQPVDEDVCHEHAQAMRNSVLLDHVDASVLLGQSLDSATAPSAWRWTPSPYTAVAALFSVAVWPPGSVLALALDYGRAHLQRSAHRRHLRVSRRAFHLQCSCLLKRFSRALRIVQEIEVVSRGFDIAPTLPPVSRMDQREESELHATTLRLILHRGAQSLCALCVSQLNRLVARHTHYNPSCRVSAHISAALALYDWDPPQTRITLTLLKTWRRTLTRVWSLVALAHSHFPLNCDDLTSEIEYSESLERIAREAERMQTHIEWAVSSTGTVHPQTHTHSESLVPLVPPQAALVRLRSLVLSSLARLNAIQQSQLDHSLSFLDSPSSLRSISAHLTLGECSLRSALAEWELVQASFFQVYSDKEETETNVEERELVKESVEEEVREVESGEYRAYTGKEEKGGGWRRRQQQPRVEETREGEQERQARREAAHAALRVLGELKAVLAVSG